jgi:hypothetical protein
MFQRMREQFQKEIFRKRRGEMCIEMLREVLETLCASIGAICRIERANDGTTTTTATMMMMMMMRSFYHYVGESWRERLFKSHKQLRIDNKISYE